MLELNEVSNLIFYKKNIIKSAAKLYKSVWLFPLLCTVVLIVLCVFKINGSSIGVYSTFFSGANKKDNNLILNRPRQIRSDEWRFNTQMIIAQSNNNYEQVNQNIGNGQDMSLIVDVPYKDWSAVFKPQNLVFFIMPFEYAFAFKWWLMAYLLVISCYFFVLSLLPKKRLVAALISITVLFSAFIQWWYQYITLAPIYYSFFALTALIHLLRSKNKNTTLVLGFVIAYLMTCFVLVLYPPFQIACAIPTVMLALGLILENKSNKQIRIKLLILVIASILSVLVCLLFFFGRKNEINVIQHTAYPGKRVEHSGGYNMAHLLSGHLGYQFQSDKKSSLYLIPSSSVLNQSESSGFLLIFPFLIPPLILFLNDDRKKKRKIDWPIIASLASSILLTLWLFVPNLSFMGKLLLLDKVPLNRVVIGMGLLNIYILVLFIRRIKDSKKSFVSRRYIALYALIIFLVELLLALHAKNMFPGFIGYYRSILFSIPIPIIVYLLLIKKIHLAMISLLTFSLFISVRVNPLYRGTSILTDTRLSSAIKTITSHDNKRWVSEDSYLENFAYMNGARSLNGIFTYPQLDIWQSFDNGTNKNIYNRYAHTSFNFDRDAEKMEDTNFVLAGGDNFGINTEPCSPILRKNDVSYILTRVKFSESESCLSLVNTIIYPSNIFYIYYISLK